MLERGSTTVLGGGGRIKSHNSNERKNAYTATRAYPVVSAHGDFDLYDGALGSLVVHLPVFVRCTVPVPAVVLVLANKHTEGEAKSG